MRPGSCADRHRLDAAVSRTIALASRHLRRRHGQRGAGILRAESVLPALDHTTPLVGLRHVLELVRRGACLGSRLVAQPSQLVLHEVRADVEEEKKAAQDEERDDEEGRHDAHEDVRENQLASDTPEQAPARESDEAKEKIAPADEQRDRADLLDDLHDGRPAHARGTGDGRQDAEHNAEHECAPGERGQERVPDRSGSRGRRGAWKRRASGSADHARD